MTCRFTLSLILLSLPPFCTMHAQAHHVSCTVMDATQKAANPAQELFWNGDAKAAAEKFKELLAQQSSQPDAEMTENSVRVLIETGDVATAAAQAKAALAAHPDSAHANTAQAEVLFREGKIAEADKLYARATQLDPCYAQARLGVYRVAHASSMYAAARSAINVAHALNQRDPDIRLVWIGTLAGQQRIDELTKFQQTLPPESEPAKRIAQQIERGKAADDPANRHPCRLVSAVESTSIPMQAILFDMTHIDKWGVDTSINGKTARLAVDSGATGLVVGRAFAEHAGLKFVEETRVSGFGDHGPQKAHIAVAETIRIGRLEFSDCEVLVSDRHDVIGLDGLIGTDVFRKYLVSVNFPDKRLDLAPLPPRPGTNEAASSTQGLSTTPESDTVGETPINAGEAPKQATPFKPQDRYVAPDMKNFSPVYRFGHLLLIDSAVNDGPAELMVLDTGNFTMSLSESAAKTVTHAHIDTVDTMRGMSGKVDKLNVGGKVTLQFGHGRASVTDIVVMNHTGMSKDIGTEISGFIGFPALQSVIFQIDYRDGLVNFVYDPKKDANRARNPGTECSYCNPGYSNR